MEFMSNGLQTGKRCSADHLTSIEIMTVLNGEIENGQIITDFIGIASGY